MPEVGGRASNVSLWIRLGYPSPLLRFLHHKVPLFSLLPVFSPFSITRFSLRAPPPILHLSSLSGYFEWNNGTWGFIIPSLTKMASSLKYVISYALALTYFTKTRWSYVCCYLRLTVNRQSYSNYSPKWGSLQRPQPLERMEEAICDLE